MFFASFTCPVSFLVFFSHLLFLSFNHKEKAITLSASQGSS